MASIYVSIPSMDDSEYFNTVLSCYQESSGKNEIHIGTAYSVLFNNKKIIEGVKNKLPDIPNLNIKFINANKNRGVGRARLESMSFYNNQDYFLQCDSHTLFLKDWDEILINSLHEAKDFFSIDKVILTGYAWPYYLISENKRLPHQDRTAPIYPRYVCMDENDYEHKSWRAFSQKIFNAYQKIPKWITPSTIEDNAFVKNKFELSTKINANMLFAEKEFAQNYEKMFPWDFFFFEEEFIMTIECFRMGWVPIYPNFDINICHLYVDSFNEFYKGRESFSISDKESDIARLKIDEYFNNNKDIINKYFKYVSIDEETRMSTKINYIPKIEDIFYGD